MVMTLAIHFLMVSNISVAPGHELHFFADDDGLPGLLLVDGIDLKLAPPVALVVLLDVVDNDGTIVLMKITRLLIIVDLGE